MHRQYLKKKECVCVLGNVQRPGSGGTGSRSKSLAAGQLIHCGSAGYRGQQSTESNNYFHRVNITNAKEYDLDVNIGVYVVGLQCEIYY